MRNVIDFLVFLFKFNINVSIYDEKKNYQSLNESVYKFVFQVQKQRQPLCKGFIREHCVNL